MEAGTLIRSFSYLIAIYLISITAVSSQSGFLDFKKISSDLAPYGYISQDHLWNDPVVSVCWENASPQAASQRLLVERAVENTWEKYAKLSFTGWANQCQRSARGVHIFVIDEGSAPRSLVGRRLDGVDKGVRLNFTFQNWGTEYCQNNVDGCIQTMAIHEFGHVLGLIHENLRDDAPQWCKDKSAALRDDSDPGDGSERTPYDPRSIMNYCNMIYGHQTTLSDLDKKVAQVMYPGIGN
jgi:hypothetical protein